MTYPASKLFLGFVLLAIFLLGCARPGLLRDDIGSNEVVYSWIDVHAHPTTGTQGLCTDDACVAYMLDQMEKYGVVTTIILLSGWRDSETAPEEDVLGLAAQYPDAFAYVGGGNQLNARIQDVAGSSSVSDAEREEFEALSREIAESGVHGFGEVFIMHITNVADQYRVVPNAGDNPLFQSLVDIAAEYDIPIDIHMDPVVADTDTPSQYLRLDADNPETLEANVADLEALLEHNRNTKIVWAHVGWDTTGDLTAELVGDLLSRHQNLYAHLQLAPALFPEHSPLDDDGNIRDEWMELFVTYPERFMIGSDAFYGAEYYGGAQLPGGEQSMQLVQGFLEQLPEDVARKIACENAVNVYNLEIECEQDS